MTDSSTTHDSAFDGITVANVRAMLAALREADVPLLSTIRRAYTDVAGKFDQIRMFLQDVGVLSEENGCLVAASALPLPNDPSLPAALVRFIVQRANRYREELFGYLRQFRVGNDGPAYTPLPGSRASYSDVRNLLMELDLLRYNAEADIYRLAPSATPIYALAVEQHRPIAPEGLQSRLLDQAELGGIAELRVLDFERRRVGKRFSDLIVHVAREDAGAGYDIRSISMMSDGATCPRYIEVKAVAPTSLCFYWSRAEFNFARIAGPWYFLYLVPVVSGQPDLESLRMLGNPCMEVLAPESGWLIEEGVIRCWRESPLPH